MSHETIAKLLEKDEYKAFTEWLHTTAYYDTDTALQGFRAGWAARSPIFALTETIGVIAGLREALKANKHWHLNFGDEGYIESTLAEENDKALALSEPYAGITDLKGGGSKND